MKIEEYNVICPKCRKIYKNRELLSFNSRMADAARDFVKNNKPITYCPDCNMKLVYEKYINYFDNSGNFCFKTETLTLPYQNEFDFHCKLISKLAEIKNCLVFETINLEGVVEKVEKEGLSKEQLEKGTADTHNLINHILIKVLNNKQIKTLFDIIVSKVNYANFGDRYNSFYIDYFTNLNKAALNIFETAISKDLKVKVKTNQIVNFDNKLKKYSN